jgi:hypothetical protein
VLPKRANFTPGKPLHGKKQQLSNAAIERTVSAVHYPCVETSISTLDPHVDDDILTRCHGVLTLATGGGQ